jgi:simple sugar transport system permease protein
MATKPISELETVQPVIAASNKHQGVGAFVSKNRRPFSALIVFLLLLGIFIIANPKVFLNPLAYRSVFTPLPISIMVTVPLVFVIASGEIDLSFGATVGMAGWAFASTVQSDGSPWLGLFLALLAGIGVGFLNGLVVTRLGLSSLVATLGMSFLVRGVIYMLTEGYNISLVHLKGTFFANLFIGNIGYLPVQMIWALAFGVFSTFLFNRHVFGTHVCCVGDNEDSANELGINAARTRTLAFIYVGLAAGFAGVMTSMLNNTFYPTSGEGLLLPVLAAIFVGGTPTWGGVGTVPGAIIGAFIIGFIETGVIAAGLTGYYTRFFYGLIIILSLVGHKFNQPRYR